MPKLFLSMLDRIFPEFPEGIFFADVAIKNRLKTVVRLAVSRTNIFVF
jgi:hypothetical protein